DVDKPEPRLAEHARPPAETTQRKAKRGSTESRRWIRAQLSNQEMRNAQLVGVNPEFVEWLRDLADRESFVSLLRLPERDKERMYDEELVLRFLFIHAKHDDEISRIRNFQDELEDFALTLALEFRDDQRAELTRVFETTFDLLQQADEDVLRRWDSSKQMFVGGFLNTSFEAIGMGLGFHIANGNKYRTDIKEAASELWAQPDMTRKFATGKSTEARLRLMVPKGRAILLQH
uniref:hypothetical protein n=2 Tax=Microbacterium TaxID=33882 RepID=UPI003016F272